MIMCEPQSNSLKLLHVIFRHGDRTPIKSHMYPKDEHLDKDFYPYGHGQLTQSGKKAMYELGEILRKRYDTYLGEMYIPAKVDCQSSSTDRTQMSLQLVVAGLFPPKKDQVLRSELNWQPIPYKCIPIEKDTVFLSVLHDKFVDVYKEYLKNSPLKGYEEFFRYFEEHTGFKNVIPRNVWMTLGTLSSEVDLGYSSPSWVLPVFKQIKEIGMLEYQLQMGTDELKRLAIGDMLSKILKDTRAKINGESTCDVHLYSGHDCNVAHVLTILGLMYPHFPRYAACIVLELHQIEENYHFKVIYKESKNTDFKLMTFPNGDTLSFEDFEKTIKQLMH